MLPSPSIGAMEATQNIFSPTYTREFPNNITSQELGFTSNITNNYKTKGIAKRNDYLRITKNTRIKAYAR